MDADGDADVDGGVGEAVVVQGVGEGVGAVGYVGYCAAEDALGVVLGEGGVAGGAAVAVAADEVEEAGFAGAVRGYLGGEVAFALAGSADVGEDAGEDTLPGATGGDQFYWGDDEAFLEDLTG